MDNPKGQPQNGVRKIPISVIIRFVLFLVALAIKGEIFGVRVTFIIIMLLLAWAAYDFFTKDLKKRSNHV